TGKVLGVETITPTSGNETPTAIISDARNNVYIGGEFANKITLNGTELTNSGGETDWFVAKFGHDNCNCTNIPEPKFTYTKNAKNDLTFTYTGSAYSTIKWDFDDGSTSTQASPNHVYTPGGWFEVCVTVTNSCGDNTYCQRLDTWPKNIDEQVWSKQVKIYPNPANAVLHVDG